MTITNNTEHQQQAVSDDISTPEIPTVTADQLPTDVPERPGDGVDSESIDSDDHDDDDMTIILLDQAIEDDRQAGFSLDWIEQHGPEMEERRRNILLRELQRVQRASFTHFALLCFIPVILLIVVLITVLNDEEDCQSIATHCQLEERSFVNAFTTRCICDPIPISRDIDGQP